MNPQSSPRTDAPRRHLRAQGRHPEGAAGLREGPDTEPRFAPAANNLAWLYSEHGGDKEKALELAQRAKEAAPDDPHISDTLGWILYKRGVYQRAVGLLKESAAKLPDQPGRPVPPRAGVPEGWETRRAPARP